MAKVSMNSVFAISPDELWKLIGKFNALPEWHPAVQSSKLEDNGRLRRLSILGVGEIVERLETIDEKDRLYRYSIVSGPMPVANYTATLRVRDDGKGQSLVEWSSEFEPASGTAENDSMKMVQNVYQTGFDNLKKMFGM